MNFQFDLPSYVIDCKRKYSGLMIIHMIKFIINLGHELHSLALRNNVGFPTF